MGWEMQGIPRRGILALLGAAAATPFIGDLPAAASQPAEVGAAASVNAWVAASLDKVRADRAWPGTPPNTLRFLGAGNERHYGQIVVTAGSDTTVTATASDLAGPNGAKIPASAVAFFYQRYVNVSRPPQNSKYLSGWWPDAVVPSNQVPAGANGNNAFMVTVRIPANQPAGVYSGSVTLTGGGAPTTVPVTLTVWGFSIPVVPSTVGAFWPWYPLAAQAENVKWGTPEFKTRMDAYYNYQMDHRVMPNYPPIIGDPGPGPYYASPGEAEPDAYIAQIAAYVNDPRVVKFQMPSYARGDQTNSITVDTAKLDKVATYLRQQGLINKAYFYVGDEPGDDHAEDTLVGAYKTLHQYAPEVPTIMTLTHRPRQSLLNEKTMPGSSKNTPSRCWTSHAPSTP